MEQITVVAAQAILALCGSTEQLPPTAKYLSQDSNGRWYAYAVKPELDGRRGVWTVKKAKVRENFWTLSEDMQVVDPTILYKIIR